MKVKKKPQQGATLSGLLFYFLG